MADPKTPKASSAPPLKPAQVKAVAAPAAPKVTPPSTKTKNGGPISNLGDYAHPPKKKK